MNWIELTRPAKIQGAKKSKGFRVQYPYHAATALVASGSAVWVDGPHEDGEDDPQGSRPAEYEEPPDTDTPEGEPMSVEDFKDLDKADQKKLIKGLGLEDEADLRSSDQMAVVYGAYLSEIEEG